VTLLEPVINLLNIAGDGPTELSIKWLVPSPSTNPIGEYLSVQHSFCFSFNIIPHKLLGNSSRNVKGQQNEGKIKNKKYFSQLILWQFTDSCPSQVPSKKVVK
jgi:hypothetical protein